MTDKQAIDQHEEILAGLVGEVAHSRIRDSYWRPVAWTYNADGSMVKGSLAHSYGVIDFYRIGDYLNCYGSDALMVCECLGLVRLAVSDRHAAEWGVPAGSSHAFIPVHSMDRDFAAIRDHGYFPRIVDSIRAVN